ncbi:unnamed protein product, partial [Durusdinium trenchii]
MLAKSGDGLAVEDPDMAAAKTHALSEFDHVHPFTSAADLKALSRDVLVGHKLAVIIDAGTSRLKVNSTYIDVCKDILTDCNLSKYAIGIVLGPRLDLMDSLMKRCQQLFKSCRTVLIQLTAGPTQRLGKALPSFLILVHSDASVPLPYSAELLKHRSESMEQPRLRCMSKMCCFRSSTEMALLISDGSQPHDTAQELNKSDCEDDQWAIFNEAEAGADEDTMDCDGLVDEDQGFYQSLLEDVMQVAGLQQLAILSTSGHPACVIAGRKIQADPRYAILLGAGRFVNDYVGVRRSPNAQWRVNY